MPTDEEKECENRSSPAPDNYSFEFIVKALPAVRENEQAL